MVRALVIEDNPADAELVRVALARQGVRVDLVHTLHDALAKVRPAWFAWLRTRHDVIIADLDLPDAGGADVVAALREADPQSRIVALSGTHDEVIARAAIRAGARRFVSKDRPDAVLGLGVLACRWADLRQQSTRALFRALRSEAER